MWRWLASRCSQSSSHSCRSPLRPICIGAQPCARVHEASTRSIASTPSTDAASLTLPNRSFTICMSMVDPATSVVPLLIDPVTSSKNRTFPWGEREVLGRGRRVRHEPAALRMRHEEVEKELGRATHHRVVLAQEAGVAGEPVVLPEVRGEPGAAGRERAPARAVHRRRDAPEVRVLVRDPPARAVVLARDASRPDRVSSRIIRNSGSAHSDEVGDLGRPVVHLGVDVGRVLRSPTAGSCWRSRCPAGWPAACPAATTRSAGSGRTGTAVPAARDRSRPTKRLQALVGRQRGVSRRIRGRSTRGGTAAGAPRHAPARSASKDVAGGLAHHRVDARFGICRSRPCSSRSWSLPPTSSVTAFARLHDEHVVVDTHQAALDGASSRDTKRRAPATPR